MGTGIEASDGSDPIATWKVRLNNLGDATLAAAVRDLLQGKSVTSTDGVLEIAYLADATPRCGTVFVRHPRAPVIVLLRVEAVDADRLHGRADRRSSLPTPTEWCHDSHWELFNCLVHSLVPRVN